MQPDDGKSYRQPKPANGHADPKLLHADTGFDGLSMGFQTVAPGCHIREHSHDKQIELQICHRGKGHVLVDGTRHELTPGTSCFLGYNVKHEIFNDGDDVGNRSRWPGGVLCDNRQGPNSKRPGTGTL